MISVNNISHAFGKVEALRNISFEVQKGTIFGLIGPDGAGKTTLIRILATLLLPSSGVASIGENNVSVNYSAIRNSIGYMPGRFSLYEDLSVIENLQLFAAIHSTTLEENYHLIADIYKQIEPFKHRRAGQLSGGMKQKLALSCAMIHAPEAILLDEPTTGVDPVSRKEFWQMLRRLRDRGTTLLVSTPYMDEAALCDRVALIHEGQFLDIDTPDGIVSKFPTYLYRARAVDNQRLLDFLREKELIKAAYLNGEFCHFTLKNISDELALSVQLEECGMQVMDYGRIKPTIEDCFLELMVRR